MSSDGGDDPAGVVVAGVPAHAARTTRKVFDQPRGADAQLVETPKWWMNLLAPIARPGSTWNHDKLMTDFGQGLAKASGGELVRVRNLTLKPGAPRFYEMPALEG